MQALAKNALTFFETKNRDSGKKFTCQKDDSPEWVSDLVRDAHQGDLPNDWRYETIVEILSAISEGGDDPPEPEIYTRALLQWLAGGDEIGPSRVDEYDRAVEEFGDSGSLVANIQLAQHMVIGEMWASVTASLEEANA